MTLPSDAMAQMFQARPANALPDLPNYNICPTQQVATIISLRDERHLGAMRWGFLPKWYQHDRDGPLLINARSETITKKPAFADAIRTRRCVIPADGFYEWSKDSTGARIPWYVQNTDGAPMLFGGLWQVWQGPNGKVASCAIMTVAASTDTAHIHPRMPLILGLQDVSLWLGEAGLGAAQLMRPVAPHAVIARRVSPRINSNRAAGPALTHSICESDLHSTRV